MARNYESAILLTGDASGAVRAIELTDDHLRQLNARQQRNKQTTSEWSQAWDRATGLMRSAALGVGAVTAGFGALAVQQTRSIVQTDNQARALGITTAQLQAMQYAAGTAGLEQDKMGDILKDVSDKIGDAYANGGGEALEVIQNLGLSTADLVRMDPAEQLLTIGSALEGLQTQGERVNAMESIANDASLLLPLLENNSAEFRRLMNQAYDLNIAIPDSDIQTYRDAYSAVYELRGASEGLFNTLISGIAQSDLSGIEQSFANLRDTVSDPQFQQAVVTIAQALVQMVDWAAEGMTEFTLLGQQIGTAAAHLSGYTNEVEDLQGKLQRLQSMKTGSLFSRAGLFDFGTGFDTYMSDSDIDEAIEHIRSRLADLGIETGGVATQTDILTSSAIAAAAALNQQGTATTVQAKNLKTLIKTYDEQHTKLLELRSAREQITQAMAEDPEHAEQYRRMLAEVDSQITNLTKSTTSNTDAKRAAEKAERAHQQALNESAQAYSRLFSAMSPMGAAQAEYDSTLADLKVELEEGTKSTLEYYAAIAQAAVEYNKAVKAADPYAETVSNLTQQYDGAYQKSQQLHQALSDLNAAYQRGDITGQQYQRMVTNIRDEMRELARESDPAAQEMARAWEEAADRIDETFADAFAGAFDGFDDFSDQLLDGFKRLLAELAYQATLKPILVGFTTSVQSALGIGGSAGVGGGFGNVGSLASMGKNLYTSVSSGLGSVSWTGVGGSAGGLYSNVATGSGGLYNNIASGGLSSGGLWGGSTGNFTGMTGLGSLGAGLAGSYVGTELGSSVFGKNANSNYGAMAGSAIGTYFGGPLGALAGGALGGALDSAFGSSRDYKAGFVQTAETPDGPANDRYYDSGDTSGLLGGRQTAFGSYGFTFKEKVEPSDMVDLLDAMEQIDNTLASIMDADEIDQVKTALNGFKSKIKNDPLLDILNDRLDVIMGAVDTSFDDLLQGVSPDEKVKRLVASLQVDKITDGLAGAVVDDVNDAFRGAVENGADLDETVASIQSAVVSLQQLGELTKSVGIAFDTTAAGALEAASNITALAGGVDNLAAMQQSYVASYYTEAEQQQLTLGSLTRQVTAFNEASGASVQDKGGLRDLIDSLDLMTESGQKTYVAALNIAGAFDQLEQIGTAAVDAVNERFDALANAAQSTFDSAQAAARQALNQFNDQSYQQQLDLLTLLGRDQNALNLQRERELETIDESLRPIQERIWALQDEKEAHEAAQKAVTDYQDALASAGDQLAGTLGSISQWVDQQTATGGSPGMDLQESQAQFARQLVAAQNGDRDALQSITQYADRYLSAGQDYYGSGTGYQSIRDDVLEALQDLPDQVSAEEYVADEIKRALLEQTASITGDLSDVLRGDNPSSIAGELASYFNVLAGGIDGVLTEDQLALIMSGKATDAQIRAMIQAMDLNGDAMVSGLESVIVSGMPTDAILANVLMAQLKANGGKALTESQVRKALSPIATDAQISNLWHKLDATGDGIVDEQELTNARLKGLSSGIAGALNPMFDKIDSSLDGLIDYDEFGKYFDGLASDKRLREIFNQLDTDGDGQISALEAVKASTDQVGDNTGSLEERSLEQLQKLTGLTSEMARSTDQFVGLNSTMVSLRESINALGVAQKEAARIEKARQEAEAAAKERVALERKLSSYESTLDGLNSKLGSTQSDIKDLNKQRDTYDYVDYRNDHAADQWSNIDKTYKGYTGYIGDENAWWESDGLHTSGNSTEKANIKNLWDVLKDYVHAFNKATGEGDKKLLELDETDFYGEGDSRNRFQIEYGGKTYYAGYNDQGIQTLDDAWDAMQDALNSYYGTDFDWRDGDSVRDQLGDAQSSLDDLLGDRNSTQKEIDDLKKQIEKLRKIEQYDGSHATGLDYVPFDGYIAETHVGERIMTAAQNRQWGPLIDGGLPPVVMPPPSMGGDNAQLERLLRDNNRLMQQNADLLRQIEQHGAAGVRVSAEGARQQIAATERGNRSLERLQSDKRLEAARA